MDAKANITKPEHFNGTFQFSQSTNIDIILKTEYQKNYCKRVTRVHTLNCIVYCVC